MNEEIQENPINSSKKENLQEILDRISKDNNLEQEEIKELLGIYNKLKKEISNYSSGKLTDIIKETLSKGINISSENDKQTLIKMLELSGLDSSKYDINLIDLSKIGSVLLEGDRIALYEKIEEVKNTESEYGNISQYSNSIISRRLGYLTNNHEYIDDSSIFGDYINNNINLPQVKSTETKPEVKSTETKPEVKSTETKPEVKSTETKPQVKSTETKPEVKSTETKPEVKSTETKPEVKSTETKPEVKSTETKPQVKSTETKPQVKSTETKPIINTAPDFKPVKTIISEGVNSNQHQTLFPLNNIEIDSQNYDKERILNLIDETVSIKLFNKEDIDNLITISNILKNIGFDISIITILYEDISKNIDLKNYFLNYSGIKILIDSKKKYSDSDFYLKIFDNFSKLDEQQKIKFLSNFKKLNLDNKILEEQINTMKDDLGKEALKTIIQNK